MPNANFGSRSLKASAVNRDKSNVAKKRDKTDMIIDFQHHYTPPELLEQGDVGILRLDEHGNPVYKLNPLLADLPAHVRMMDRAGIDVAVLSCGSGFDQTRIATCCLINDRMRQAERDYPGRFIGLGHVPAFDVEACSAELRRCAVELGFPGVVIASELQGHALDAEALRPFWRRCADLDLYVYIHPLPHVIAWPQMYVDDLGRMLGWEFSLMVSMVRLINSGLFDELPTLRVRLLAFRRRDRALSAANSRPAGSREKRDHLAAEPRAHATRAVRLLPGGPFGVRLLRMVERRPRRRGRFAMGAGRPRRIVEVTNRLRHGLSARGAGRRAGCGVTWKRSGPAATRRVAMLNGANAEF